MNILVIDDNLALGETQAMMLDVLGHTPTIAVTGYAGIEAAKTCRPQLILLDLGLPDIDGNEVCRQLRQNEDAWRRCDRSANGPQRYERFRCCQSLGFRPSDRQTGASRAIAGAYRFNRPGLSGEPGCCDGDAPTPANAISTPSFSMIEADGSVHLHVYQRRTLS